MVMYMKGTGKMIKLMVKEFIFILMALNMKENGLTTSSMAME